MPSAGDIETQGLRLSFHGVQSCGADCRRQGAGGTNVSQHLLICVSVFKSCTKELTCFYSSDLCLSVPMDFTHSHRPQLSFFLSGSSAKVWLVRTAQGFPIDT